MCDKVPRILIVEDDAHELGLAVRALKAAGMAVDTARDGAEALDRLLGPGPPRRPLPKLVLLDLNLPKIDGFEVARRLKAEVSTRGIPIVAFSSSSEERDLVECYQSGVNSYIVKPVDFGQLLAILGCVSRYWVDLNRVPGVAS